MIDEIVARAEVKHHHYLNFTGGGRCRASTRAIGLRFIEFLDPGERVDPDAHSLSSRRTRVASRVAHPRLAKPV